MLISSARTSQRRPPMFLIDTPLFLAAVTIGRLRRGVELIRHRGDQPQAQLLELDGDDFTGCGVRLLHPFQAS